MYVIGNAMKPTELQDIWATIFSAFQPFWNFEIISLDKDPITSGEVLLAVICFVLGYIVSKSLSNTLRKKLYSRFNLTVGAAAALQTISFYLLVLFFTVLALRIAHIPLTLFAILGSAFAIGIGFGSQNLINNFISGLILMVERPIKVGDMIEIDGAYGKVVKIGARCTQVHTFTNIDILVPNSAFLEKNVINWTLTDDQVRTSINVGVAYGSDVRKVEETLKQAVVENKKILKSPEPIILFSNFGDSALNFDIHFWIKMSQQMDRRIIESDLRYSIDRLFKVGGITIAFPQRDIHVNTLSPLEVKMVQE